MKERSEALSLAFLDIAPVAAAVTAMVLVTTIVVSAPQSPTRAAPDPVPGQRALADAAPVLTFRPAPGALLSRMVDIEFLSDVWLLAANVTLAPDPGVRCDVILDTAQVGRVRCREPLPGGREYVAHVSAIARYGGLGRSVAYPFRTREKLDRLVGVPWFTEFEDPAAEPLACAAASIRIVNTYTSRSDPLGTNAILKWARQFNRSADPGLDPVAIATALKRLDPANNYHYYVYASREEATKAAIHWLLQSAKPVVAITLAGQHAPVIVGFTGQIGDRYDDPASSITGVVVMDPQRGDLDPRTARFRLDKSRSAEYQTGREVPITEWYLDEWWFGAAYAGSLTAPGGKVVDIDRSDGAYPRPHWAGGFVIIVDDGDAALASDRVGRRAPG